MTSTVSRSGQMMRISRAPSQSTLQCFWFSFTCRHLALTDASLHFILIAHLDTHLIPSHTDSGCSSIVCTVWSTTAGGGSLPSVHLPGSPPKTLQLSMHLQAATVPPSHLLSSSLAS